MTFWYFAEDSRDSITLEEVGKILGWQRNCFPRRFQFEYLGDGVVQKSGVRALQKTASFTQFDPVSMTFSLKRKSAKSQLASPVHVECFAKWNFDKKRHALHLPRKFWGELAFGRGPIACFDRPQVRFGECVEWRCVVLCDFCGHLRMAAKHIPN